MVQIEIIDIFTRDDVDPRIPVGIEIEKSVELLLLFFGKFWEICIDDVHFS
jgi:hypothetical protein